MKIVKSYNFHRRDFVADMECQHCGHTITRVCCYDDSYFHQQVIPNKKCDKCGKTGGEVTSGARFNDDVVM